MNDSNKLFNEITNELTQKGQIFETREYKNNFEYWFYNWIRKKGNNVVVKTDRSNMKDLILVEVSTGKELGVIPMPKGYTSGVGSDLKKLTEQLINKST